MSCVDTNLPADARGQILHNQAVLSAHRRRVSTETKKNQLNQLNGNIVYLSHRL